MPSKQSPNKKELLSAIRQKCLDCSGGMRSEIRNCLVKNCSLRPYRMTNPDSNTTLLDNLVDTGDLDGADVCK